MAYKPLPIKVAKDLLYLMKVMHEAIVLSRPKRMSEARLMLHSFEMICEEGIKEAEEALEPAAIAA